MLCLFQSTLSKRILLICSCCGKQTCHTQPYFSTSCWLRRFIYSRLCLKLKLLHPVCASVYLLKFPCATVVNDLSLCYTCIFHSYPSILVSFRRGCQGNRVIRAKQRSSFLDALSWEIQIACGHLENVALPCVDAISCTSTSSILPRPRSSSPEMNQLSAALKKTTVSMWRTSSTGSPL